MNRRSLTAASKRNNCVLFNKDYIFFNKMGRIKVKVEGVLTMEGLSYFELGGGGTIHNSHEKQIVIKNKNFELLTKIKDADLFCKVAMYHASCRKTFIRNSVAWRSSSPLLMITRTKWRKRTEQHLVR